MKAPTWNVVDNESFAFCLSSPRGIFRFFAVMSSSLKENEKSYYNNILLFFARCFGSNMSRMTRNGGKFHEFSPQMLQAVKKMSRRKLYSEQRDDGDGGLSVRGVESSRSHSIMVPRKLC